MLSNYFKAAIDNLLVTGRRTRGGLAIALASGGLVAGCAMAPDGGDAPAPGSPEGEWVAVADLPSGEARAPLTLRNTSLGVAGWAAGGGRVVPVRGVDSGNPGALLVPELEMRFDLAWDPAARRWAGAATVGEETGPARLTSAGWEESLVSADFDGPPPAAVVLPDGRWARLDCRGSGAPAVVLDAGATGGAFDWRQVHDQIAETTRACAFDRAGLGLSDAGPMPRDAAAIVADERAMLAAAGIEEPYVLVGHSLASLHVRYFANTHPGEVAGIVLLDPAAAFQNLRFAEVAPQIVQNPVDAAVVRQCLDDMRADLVLRTSETYRRCGGNDPDRLETVNSEGDSAFSLSSQQVVDTARNFGALPMIVLTAGDWADDAPPGLLSAEEKAAATSLWRALHEELAALSAIGEHRIVPGARHYIHQTRPQAVIDAVNEVVAAARTRE